MQCVPVIQRKGQIDNQLELAYQEKLVSVWMDVLVWCGRWDKVSLVRTGLINGRLWLVMVCGIGGLCRRRVGVRCEAHFANVSASSLPCMPIWERIHCVLCGKGGMRWVSIWYQRVGLFGLL